MRPQRRKRDQIKQRHEKAVADQLLEVLKIAANFEAMGDPTRGEPDVIYAVAGKKLGIEVATVYYDNTDARDGWTLAAGEREFSPAGYELRSGSTIVDPSSLMFRRIQTEVDDKCSKQYERADEVWLCLEVRTALLDNMKVRECVRALNVPAGHEFKRLYVLYTSPLDQGLLPTAVEFR